MGMSMLGPIGGALVRKGDNQCDMVGRGQPLNLQSSDKVQGLSCFGGIKKSD